MYLFTWITFHLPTPEGWMAGVTFLPLLIRLSARLRKMLSTNFVEIFWSGGMCN